MKKGQSKGHPQVTIRLHPQAIERLKKRSETEPGRQSGVAAFIRYVVYQALDFDSDEWEAAQAG